MISIRTSNCHMTDSPRRLFALIPAAGRSRRMGTSKLLLPWNDQTVVEHLIGTLARPEITAVAIVVRPDDHALWEVVQRTSAVAVIPDQAPPEMRDSIELGLRAIRQRFAPNAADGWLLIPADHPLIEPEVLDGLLTRWSRGDCEALLPTFGQRRGHPTLLRWSLASRIEQLPRDVGVNTLLRSEPSLVTEWPTDRESVLADLDTPEDYAFWQQKLASESVASH
jgi:molybdenum cofactor cytidylyltransferase